MTENQACRACLAAEVNLYNVSNTDYHLFYQQLTNIPFQDGSGKPTALCSECIHLFRKSMELREKCLRAERVLSDFIHSGVQITFKSISSIDRNGQYLSSRLNWTDIESITISPVKSEYSEVNTNNTRHLAFVKENEVKIEVLTHTNERIQDIDESNLKVDRSNDDYGDNYSSDDDDVPLNVVSEKIKGNDDGISEEKNEKLPKQEYAKEVQLSKEEQLLEFTQRASSTNYLHSPFKCDLCFKGFVDEVAFNNHLEKHDKKYGDYICGICKLRYETTRKLKMHSISAHERKYDCLQCGHRTLTAHQAREHSRWHRGQTYDCELCGKCFRKPTSLFSHTRSAHPAECVCVTCGVGFSARHGLRMHTAKAHKHDQYTEIGPPSERTCKSCSLVFVSREAWTRHVVTSLRHIREQNGSDTCNVCGMKFDSGTDVSAHMRDHVEVVTRKRKTKISASNVKMLPCEQCNHSFSSWSTLQHHVKRVHLGMKYVKNIVCEVCGKNCTSNAALIYHQRTHTGEKPYACKDCPKKFADSNKLRIHYRTHSDERPYSCSLCSKTFRQKPALNRHMRVHTGVKPYTCEYCSKAFSQSNSKKLHVRTVHLKLPPNNRKNRAHTGANLDFKAS